MSDQAAGGEPAGRGGRRASWRKRAAGLAVALAAPGLVTLVAFATVRTAVPALLYVAAICAAASAGGVVAGVVAAAGSFSAFTYFFTPPYHSWTIRGTADAVALASFAVVGVGVSQALAHERRLRDSERDARRRAEAAVAHTVRLEAVARALSQARTPQAVLDAVLAEGLAAAEARAGLIAVVSEDGTALEVAAQRGYASGRIDRWARFELDRQLPLSDAVRTGEPVYLSSTAERDRRYPLLADMTEQSHALACLPLVFESRTIGGLVLSFPADEEFDAERRALKEALAAQVAQALDRARLDEAEAQLRERLAFLAEAGELLTSSLDYAQTLSGLAALAVPRLADWCSIDVVGVDGSIERLAVAHRDPEKVRYARELAERYPPDPAARRGVPQVLRSGEPEFIPEIDDDLLVAAAGDDEELLRILRELGLRSAITVPLLARGRTLGALTLIAAEQVPPYTRADLELAVDLARRAAVAVDNARLHAEAEQRADAARALEHVVDAVVLVEPGGRPRYWNRAAAALLGDTGGGMHAAWERLRGQLERLERTEAAPATLPVELDGREHWLQVTRVQFGEGSVYALRDVTEERLLERTRSEFVATASHELRTPIAAVYGTFQTLLREDIELDREQLRSFLEIGRQESERLARIVDDLLLAGQLDGGNPRVERTTCELAPLIEDVVSSTAGRLKGTHDLNAAVGEPLPTVECDPMRLRQVLANLIENAVKYSPEGGAVEVSARARNGVVRIEVSDEGIGIPEPDQGRIFERFVRLDPALSRGVGGAGLGLYICRELVRRMGGTIGVSSREGEGSTFVVELPAAAGT